MDHGITVSSHWFRRTARKAAHKRNDALPVNALIHYKVEPAKRGPFKWSVRRYPLPERVRARVDELN